VSVDGQWIALGTRKRTVHAITVNPHEGEPNKKSYLDERVQNATKLVSSYSPVLMLN
jgi:hypothetical protein